MELLVILIPYSYVLLIQTHRNGNIGIIAMRGFKVWKQKLISYKMLPPVSIELGISAFPVWCLSNWANLACASWRIFKLSFVHAPLWFLDSWLIKNPITIIQACTVREWTLKLQGQIQGVKSSSSNLWHKFFSLFSYSTKKINGFSSSSWKSRFILNKITDQLEFYWVAVFSLTLVWLPMVSRSYWQASDFFKLLTQWHFCGTEKWGQHFLLIF